MKHWLCRLSLSLSLVLVGVLAAAAQAAYPERPIRIVVPYPAGSPLDATARAVGDALARRLNQPVIVDNRPGAAGNIGAEAAFRAKPDGYTLMLGNSDILSINALLYRHLKFEPERFEPVGLIGSVPSLLVARSQLAAASGSELIRLARGNVGGVSYGSWGVGSSAHLAGVLMESSAGISLLHVPYQGAGLAVQALLGGQIDLMVVPVPLAQAQLSAGRVKVLGALGAQRVAAFPDTPTLAEQGFGGYAWDTWLALVAPPGVPPATLERLNRELGAVMGDPAVSAQLREIGIEARPGGRAALSEEQRRTREHWRRVIVERGIRID